MPRKSKALPLNRMSERCSSGIFLKQTSDWESGDRVIIPHRDDYYMFTVLTGGEAAVAVDFRDLTLIPHCPDRLYILHKKAMGRKKVQFLWHRHVKVVNPAASTGCRKCVEACPQELFVLNRKRV